MQSTLLQARKSAQQARADADAAQATAHHWSQQAENFQTVVSETKQASQILQNEHTQLQTALSNLQSKLAQHGATQAMVDQWKAKTLQAKLRVRHLEQELVQAQADCQVAQDRAQTQHSEWQHQVTVNQAREDRVHQLEDELKETQALLQQATSERESLPLESLRELQKLNEDLHAKLTEEQDRSHKQQERWNETLTKAEQEAQQWRLQAETSNDLVQKLKAEKANQEQLQKDWEAKRAASNELKAAVSEKEASSLAPTTPAPQPSHVWTPARPTLPPLSTDHKLACCVCSKPPMGMMKGCQCGQNCRFKAHAKCCLQVGPSVAHPGTPAPPLILCQRSE